MQLAFPAERLFEMRMAGGPLALRHRAVMSGLLTGAPVFDYSPEEVVAMRNWWLSLPGRSDAGARSSRAFCVELIERAFSDAKRCLRCAGELAGTGTETMRCPKCG